MDLDQAKSQLLDSKLAAYTEELRGAEDDSAAVTLAYTHGIQRAWRSVLQMLPIPAGSTVVDVGSGLGILGFELAANAPLAVIGVELDTSFVAHSNELRDRLSSLFVDGASVEFLAGDAHQLPLDDDCCDLVFVRELFQFLDDPASAVRELFRVLRPGGFACVSEMDDQMRITWPPDSPAQERLVAAVSAVQHQHGGDRHAGRKLTTHLRAGGFTINSLLVLPEAQHRLVDAGDAERALVVEQLHAARARVLAAGLMDAAAFDADLAEVEAAEAFEQFRLSGRIVVLARRPVPTV